jgi:hypothetical protein
VNPYLVERPACVSFSGGRTSGYMLKYIIDAYGGSLPDDVIPVFANTGKEREETLQFVQECSNRWGVRVRWVEWRDTPAGFEEVGNNSASRVGEPFRALIEKKGMPPNWQARFCTQFLKVKTMTAFMSSMGYEPGSYFEVIGLRYDEGHRVFKMLARNDSDGRKCVAPIARAKDTLVEVSEFWNAQPFDLGLRPGEGNCDLCFLKGKRLLKALIRERPESVKWWIDAEQSVNGFFSKRDSYDELRLEVEKQPDLFGGPLEEEHDVECGLLCGEDD